MNKTIPTPEGTRDRLFAECAAFRQVERSVTETFRRHGYCEMTTPNVEYYDLVTAAGDPIAQEAMLKIVDRSGKILAMRPDSTLAMGRVVATKLTGLPRPLRLYYNQMVFRSDDANTGARTEIDQCGVELIGASGIRADLEIISLSLAALEACGLQEYHIEIGHAGYVSSLLRELETENGEELLQLAERREFTAYQKRLEPWLHTAAGQALYELPRLFGGPDILDCARKLCAAPGAIAALDYLESLYDVLRTAGLSHRVQVDLAMTQTIEYYTGMIFRGYGRGAADSVLSGGRYEIGRASCRERE